MVLPDDRHAEAFERALADDPHSLANWAVYADYLAERGDPRGEFMQVQIALEDESLTAESRAAFKVREAALLAKHERDWLGPLAAVTVDASSSRSNEYPVAHRFARGWLTRLEFICLTVNQARTLAKTEEARFLRELVVQNVADERPTGTTGYSGVRSEYEPGPDVPEVQSYLDVPGLHALSRCPYLANLRLFHLGSTEEGSCYAHVGNMAYPLVALMPHLEELYVGTSGVDASRLFSLPLPRLRVLQLYHNESYPLDRLAANPSLGNLDTLLCYPHGLHYDAEEAAGAYIRLEHLRAVCRSPHLTALTTLRLRLTDFGDAGATEIVESGALKRLTVLDLEGGCMTDAGARALAACPDVKRFRSLNLNRNALTEAGRSAILATGVNATLDAQHRNERDEMESWAPDYLYWGDDE